ncbi:hypothetical protein CR983_03295 [Candidatus Saccharibacteria bacterium]|nr:MAG: hypothetical protein CR983_03295 [Candidatus Saccharibacteria bacterium]
MRDSLTITIDHIRRESSDVVTLYFARPFDFIAGQYISVYFDDLGVPEGKAYSLSSRPTDALASITVKDIGGPWSSRLCRMKAGDTLQISRAYGYFNPHTDAPLVGIAAGVGLSPVWSVLASDDDARHCLHFANTHDSHIPFRDELATLETRVTHYISRQADTMYHRGRMEIEHVVAQAEAEAHYLICGSMTFVRDIFHQLEQQGIARSHISTEVFFEHL